MKVYVNGVQVTAFATANYPSQNSTSNINTAGLTYIGRYGNSNAYTDSYMAEANFVDGQALAATSFGQYDQFSNWTSKKYTGTYGTNGFYLPFSNNSSTGTLGLDFSGNNNTWTTNNFSVTAGSTYDSMTDVPTQWTPYNVTGDVGGIVRGNYPTANPLMNLGGIVTLSNANLKITKSGNGDYIIPATMAIPAGTGKWYWEVTATTISASSNFSLGVVTNTITTGSWAASSGSAVFWNGSSGSRQAYGVASTGTTWSVASGDIIGQALDATTGNFSLYKNGVLVETWNASVNTALSSFPFASSYANTEAYSYNFGQYAFTYAPPSGYKSLCTTNLPTPTIQQGNLVMDATLYVGNNASQTITNTGGFKPDLVWTKARANAYSPNLYDSVRGVNQNLQPNSTGADFFNANSLTSFNSNGFTVGANDNGNASSSSVGWQWQAGQGSSSSNTNGSITSTVSVNASAGFSVVTYTGTGSNATVGHGLGVAPSMIIAKSRSGITDWNVYHSSLGATQAIYLNRTTAAQTSSAFWNNTAPTSSVFSLGTGTDINASGATNVAYCWAEIAGFSKFGSYTGNGSADGPFVYLGFRPKFVMIKVTSTTSNWFMFDSSRNTYNVVDDYLLANSSAAGATATFLDFTSNGFKLRNAGSGTNGSGDNFIYMAFAEYPFKSALGR
jgi:hypothetical protein